MANDKVNDKEVSHLDSFASPAGRFDFSYLVREDASGSSLPEDLSHMTFQDKWKSFLTFRGGASIWNAVSDMSILCGRNFSWSIKGDLMDNVYGDRQRLTTGHQIDLQGQHTSQAKAAAKALKESHDEIHEAAVKAFESTEGSEIKCPTCTKKMVHQKASQLAGKVVTTLVKYLKYLPYINTAKEKVQKILTSIITPFLSRSSNISVLGESCGNPSCKNGVMKTDQAKQEAFNRVSEQMLKERQDKHLEHEKQLGAKHEVKHVPTSYSIVVGYPDVAGQRKKPFGKGESYLGVYGIDKKNQNNGKGGGHSGKGAEKNPQKLLPLAKLPFGDFSVTCDELILNSGSHGKQLLSEGPIKIAGGQVEITSSESVVTIASKSRLTLKGANIHLDANQPDANGIEVDSRGTHFKGGITVDGNIYLKGAVLGEGSVHAPTLVCRDMSTWTTPSAACDTNTHGAYHNSTFPIPNGHQGTIWNGIGLALKAVMQAIDLLDISKILSSLFNWILEALHLKKSLLPVENTGIPTGFGLAYDCATYSPLKVVGGCTMGGLVAGVVIPAFTAKWSHPHVHPQISGHHNHEVSVPAYSGYPETADVYANTPGGSHVPYPPVEPMGYCPGPKSLPGSCGGGGAGFGNPNKYQTRNAAYGAAYPDPFQGFNYVPTTEVTYTSGGQVYPPPKFSLQC
jgi:hypothetical protein